MSTESGLRRERLFHAVETMLRHSRPKRDNDALMASLRSHFDSPIAMLNATPYMLEKCGMHPHDALLFSKMPELIRASRRGSFVKHPQLGRLPLAAEFLLDNAYALKVERFYMLCLDARGRMKECVFIQEGTESGTLFNLRKLLVEVVRVAPNAVVISHNHPRRTLRPSQDDIDCTRAAIRALAGLGVPLLDHVIIAGGHAVSMRDNGFIPAQVWLRQAPENKLLKNWLSDAPLPNVNNRRSLPMPK
ncbi:MAG: JAB domain-containing protein [Clostridia bacterium]|nr:JAB domain-containing protein [Clostridia bacterium]